MNVVATVIALVALGALVSACEGGGRGSPLEFGTDHPSPTTTVELGDEQGVVVAAGDIASCRSPGDEATAALVEGVGAGATVVTLGDTVYERGTAAEFAQCYGPSWGRFRDRTRPVPGNHDYASMGAGGYFDYFGTEAGRRGQGWYSYDLGTWHVVALNSNCRAVGGCGPGSAQERWLRADLAAHPTHCTLAYWHHPRWSSGIQGSSAATAGLWEALGAAGAELVLSGHDHDYERFAPLGADGAPAPGQPGPGRPTPGQIGSGQGVRQFVVGTGGHSHHPILFPRRGSQSRTGTTFGVLTLHLYRDGYRWRFLSTPPGRFTDQGSDRCR